MIIPTIAILLRISLRHASFAGVERPLFSPFLRELIFSIAGVVIFAI